MAAELGHEIPVLRDVTMRVIFQYGMKGGGMGMADMGYVVIDRAGRVRMRRIDRSFGDHAEEIVAVLRGPNTRPTEVEEVNRSGRSLREDRLVGTPGR